MAKNRKLLSVGTPVRLSHLIALCETVADGLESVEAANECVVRHSNGQLIIERPEATLVVDEDPI